MMTANSDSTCATVSIHNSEFVKNVTIPKGKTVTIEIPNPQERKGTGMCQRTVIIKANPAITVMSRSYKKTSGDVTLIHPLDWWGKEYYIVTPTNGPSNHYPEFGVLTHEIATTVTLELTGAIEYNKKNYQKGDKLTVNLEPFQFMQIQSQDDLSGSRVTSQYPVAVLSGHSCAPNNGGCSHVYEQLKPVHNWGNSYFVPNLSFQSNNDMVFIMSSKDTCLEYQSGGQKTKTKVSSGQLMRFNVSVSSPFSIHSKEKIEVMLYGTGGKSKGQTFGSFLTTIPSTECFNRAFNLIGQEDFNNNLAIVIAKTVKGSEIMFNEKALKNLKWKEFHESEYSWVEYNYGSDFSSNTVKHASEPFGLLTIGYSKNKAYGSEAAGI
ncbi:hypothetical protein PRIEUP_LOCUS1884, partial [Pristimantis euphronides]